tara:strand:+ start:83 stop:910 length:828 start_codon:yes stop_codon:yes gene_type:complete
MAATMSPQMPAALWTMFQKPSPTPRYPPGIQLGRTAGAHNPEMDEVLEYVDNVMTSPTAEEQEAIAEYNCIVQELLQADGGFARSTMLPEMAADMDRFEDWRNGVEAFHGLLAKTAPGEGEYYTEHTSYRHAMRPDRKSFNTGEIEPYMTNWIFIKHPGCPGNESYDTLDLVEETWPLKGCITDQRLSPANYGPPRPHGAVDGVLNKDNRTILEARLSVKGEKYATFESPYGKIRVDKKFFTIKKFPVDSTQTVRMIVALQDVERNIRWTCVKIL